MTTFKPSYIEVLAGQSDQDLEDFVSPLTDTQQAAFWEQIKAARR